ncbi:hypothetical protein [Thermococcus sp. AM4]|uniref:hypothetical protein n=1 Tax=Thermococcus sp. (strain AM4) TaxID=246969 RepID=UPI0001870F54|nr:hypothetical protein [Thermococcus sp. AM4]EEB74028.1 conserved hypothetical protein [Thermococcus sp. AM4]
MVLGRKKRLKFIDGIPHGTHMDSLCLSQDWGIGLIEAALAGKYPTRKAAFEKKKLIGSRKFEFEIVDVPLARELWLRVVKVDRTPVTAFPVLSGEKVDFEVKEVLEWKEWPEADIAGTVVNEHSPALVFYAADYVENREKYLGSERIRVGLSFFVYSGTAGVIERTTTRLPDGKEVVIDLNEAEILLPAAVSVQGAFIDDYVMTAHVLDLEEVSTPCGGGYIMLLSNEPLGRVRAFALKERLRGEIEKGASLKLVGWLQGGL